ncbi:hypothetical protein BDV24DRAFT_158324 [Aspergillus arachidicola]|uniref:Uncharacterized protein n=1 Tax=Aspergillus arachidicola TaxID=656916 RepID=A0A5N6YMG8_9EURO|nr:hypothetical protein BDV24DRAFT_158324 [Aspergillus arachidicola]
MHTGLASLPSFTAPDGSKVYVGVYLHAYLAYPSSRDEQGSIGLASIYRALGFNVMITAPTHFAADVICEGLQKVYRPLSESRTFRNHGKSITDLEADTAAQDGDKPLSGGEDGGEDKTTSATVPEGNTKAAAIKPPNSNTAVIQDNHAEATPDTAKVIEMAPDNNKPMMARRPSDEQVLDQVTNFLLLVETVKL